MKRRSLLKRVFTMTLAMAVTLTSIPFQAMAQEGVQTAKQSKGLIADFNFDDSESGFKGAGAVAVGLTQSVLAERDGGKALSLDGTDKNYLKVTKEDGTSLLTGVEEITVSFDAMDERKEPNWAFFMAPNTKTQDYAFEHYVGILHSGGKLTMERYNNNGGRPGNNISADVPMNVWNHIDLVLTEKTSTVYMNGVQVGFHESAFKLTDILGGDSIIQIGKANWVNGEYYKGQIDNFQIYNFAFTADEIINGPDLREKVALTYTPGQGGTIEGEGSQEILKGADGQTVTAVPNEGYRFSKWSDGLSTEQRTDKAVAEDLNVTAYFTSNENPLDPTLPEIAEGLVAHYDMSGLTADGKLEDLSSSGHDAKYTGTAEDFSMDGQITVLNFTGNKKKYVELPSMISGEEFTIETTVKAAEGANHWLWCLGSVVQPTGKNYIFANAKQPNGTIRMGIKDEANQKLFPENQALKDGEYGRITLTYKNGIMLWFLNGKEISSFKTNIKVQDILAKGTSNNIMGFMGRSLWEPDPGLKAQVADFKVYDRALTSEEVSGQVFYDDVQAVGKAAEMLAIPNADDIRGNITLPDSMFGTSIVWTTTDANVISVTETANIDYDPVPAGVVTRGNEDQRVTLTAQIEKGDASDTKVFELVVKKQAVQKPYEAYLFGSFTGGESNETDEQIYFASSKDGLNYQDLNEFKPVLTSDIGEKGVRDPYLFRSAEGDKFYMLATDLSIYHRGGWGNAAATTTGSRDLIIWESTDLVNWSAPRSVQVSLPTGGCAWAPEAIYDEKTGEYVVFWATNDMTDEIGDGVLQVYYSKTRDFYHFTDAKEYITRGAQRSIIDTSMLKVGDKYYRASADGQITLEVSDRVLGEWTKVTDLSSLGLGGDLSGGKLEGPELIAFNDGQTFGLFSDQFAEGKGYLPVITTDLSDADNSRESWTKLSANQYNFDLLKKRHGTILNITQEEYDAVMLAYDKQIEEEPVEPEVLASFDFNGADPLDGGSAKAAAVGNTAYSTDAISGNALKMSGSNYLNLTKKDGSSLLTGLNRVTISYYSKSEKADASWSVFAAPNANTQVYGKEHYLGIADTTAKVVAERYNNNGLRPASITMESGDKWKHVAIVVEGNRTTLYIDGVSRKLSSMHQLKDILGDTSILQLGKGNWEKGEYFKGLIDDVSIYNYPLTAEEVQVLADKVTKPLEMVTLKYKAGTGGTISGETTQSVIKGSDGQSVTAVAEEGYTFGKWSDGLTTAQRTDLAADKDLEVTAYFTKNEGPVDPTLPEITEGLIAHYDMSGLTEEGKLEDKSGQGHDAKYTGTPEDFFTDGEIDVLNFTGDKTKYVELPSMIEGEEFTIDTTVKASEGANHWLWCLGSVVQATGKNYIFANAKQSNGTIRMGIKDETNQKLFPTNQSLKDGEYGRITVTYQNGVMSWFLNGKEISSFRTDIKVQDILSRGTANNVMGYIGRSLWSADPGLKAQVADFKVYDRALSSQEVSGQALYSEEQAVANAAQMLTIPNADDIRGNITLPDSMYGTSIEWTTTNAAAITVTETANENYDAAPAGVVTRGNENQNVTLTAKIKKGNAEDTKEFNLVVKKKAVQKPYNAYLFGSFTGTEGNPMDEQIYFASSKDGLNYQDLNDFKPVLTSNIGEKGVRDPYLFRSAEGDKFYMLATDLSIYYRGGWGNAAATITGSRDLIIWESDDLVNWSAPRAVTVSLPTGGCAWAPEAIYDEKTGEYVIFWATNDMTDNINDGVLQIYYSKTRDFYHFTEAKEYITRGADRSIIDTTMLKVGDNYYRASADGQITLEVSDSVMGEWSRVTDLNSLGLGGDMTGGKLEGPELIAFNDGKTFGLFTDQYAEGRGYLPVITTDLSDADNSKGSWTKLNSSQYNFDLLKKRHGTILNITQEEYDAVMKAYDTNVEEPVEPEELAAFTFDGADPLDGGSAKAAAVGNVEYSNDSVTGKALKLNGSDYLNVTKKDGSSLLTGQNTITISYYSKSEKSDASWSVFAAPNADTQVYTKEHYLGITDTNAKVLAERFNNDGPRPAAITMTSGDKWKHVALVVERSTTTLYVNGASQKISSMHQLKDILGENSILQIGKGNWVNGEYFKGLIDDLSIYNYPLTAQEVQVLADKVPEPVDRVSLTYKAGTGGTISGEAGQSVIKGSDGTAVTAVPKEGYLFTKWDDGIKTAERTDLAVTESKTYTALFAKKEVPAEKVTVTYRAAEGGSIRGTAVQTINKGSSTTAVTAAAKAGYVFIKWSDDILTPQRIDRAVNEDITITALFDKIEVPETKVTITYQAGEGGRITGSAVQTITKGGDTAAVTAAANEGYVFQKWNDGVTTAVRTDKGVMADKTVTAIFEKSAPAPTEKVTVTYKASSGGTITGSAVQTIDKGGSTSTVRAAASKGYVFTQWSDGIKTSSRSDKNVTASKTLTAIFTKAVPAKVKLSTSKVTLGVKEKISLKASVSPAGVSQKVTWSSDDKSKATVSQSGKVTAKKAGTVKIKARTSNGKTAVCVITIKKAPSSIQLNAKEKTLKKGKTYQLKVKLTKKSASNQITYKSKNSSVASVSSKGKITAKKKGTTKITVSTFNGKKAQIVIKVK